MTDFIDIETAVKLTKTSDSTLRRFLRDLKKDDRQKYVSRQGRKVVIERQFVLRSFDISEDFIPEEKHAGKVAKIPFDVVEFQRQQLTEKDRQIRQLQDHNDRLLSDLKDKDHDLKASWSKISALQDENKLLTADVKALKQADQIEEKTETRYNTLLLILVLVIVGISIYLVVTS